MPFLFFFELFLLFVLSRKTTQNISLLLYLLLRNKKAAIWGMAILFLPGTIIHEFSHAIMAFLLHVRVGEMELFPEYKDGGLKLGSVQVAKTDPFRNFFIGVAPFIFGTGILLIIIYLIMSSGSPFTWWVLFPFLYLIFTVSNTMFSSKKDLEGAIEFFILVGVLSIVSYLLGFHPQEVDWGFLNGLQPLFKTGIMSLSIPIGIDVVIVLLALLFTRRF